MEQHTLAMVITTANAHPVRQRGPTGSAGECEDLAVPDSPCAAVCLQWGTFRIDHTCGGACGGYRVVPRRVIEGELKYDERKYVMFFFAFKYSYILAFERNGSGHGE